MTKAYKYIPTFVILSIVIGMLSLSSCHKNEAMEVTILAKLMADTSVRMPGVRIELSKGDVKIGGYTDGNGEFRYTFEHPVQLDIHAYNDTLSGIGVINVAEYGIDYKKSVYIF